MAGSPVAPHRFWHPISFWKVLLIFFLVQLVFQPLFAALLALLGFEGSWGASLGAGVGAAAALWIVWFLAARAARDSPRSEDT